MKKNLIIIICIFLLLAIAVIVFISQLPVSKTLEMPIGKVELQAPRSWEIKLGDGTNSFGAIKTGYSVSASTKKIPEGQIENETNSWISLYNISVKYGLGVYNLDETYVLISNLNGINLYRKKLDSLTDEQKLNTQLVTYGEFTPGKLLYMILLMIE